MFSQYVKEKLRYYVYLLRDPESGEVFYVGKGTGDRIFAHAKDSLSLDEEEPSDKLDRIRVIHQRGLEVRYDLLRFGLTEKEAFKCEPRRTRRGNSSRPHDVPQGP